MFYQMFSLYSVNQQTTVSLDRSIISEYGEIIDTSRNHTLPCTGCYASSSSLGDRPAYSYFDYVTRTIHYHDWSTDELLCSQELGWMPSLIISTAVTRHGAFANIGGSHGDWLAGPNGAHIIKSASGHITVDKTGERIYVLHDRDTCEYAMPYNDSLGHIWSLPSKMSKTIRAFAISNILGYVDDNGASLYDTRLKSDDHPQMLIAGIDISVDDIDRIIRATFVTDTVVALYTSTVRQTNNQHRVCCADMRAPGQLFMLIDGECDRPRYGIAI